MNRSKIANRLALAERHVAAGEVVLTRQRELIELLRSGQQATGQAESLLVEFEGAQAMYVADRDRLRNELVRADRPT